MILDTFKDFLQGLGRGLKLFLTEREHTAGQVSRTGENTRRN